MKIASSILLSTLLMASWPVEGSPAETGLVVHSNDLDLASRDGLRVLRWRIETAAGRICGSTAGMTFTQSWPIRLCRRAAIGRAEGQVQALLAGTGQGGNARNGDTSISLR